MPRLRRLGGPARRRPGLVGLSLVTLAAFFLYPVFAIHPWDPKLAGAFRFYDYVIYADAVDAWLAGGDIYGADASGDFHGSYLYPPITVLFFVPFTGFEPRTAATLMEGASLITLWVGLEAVAATLGHRLRIRERLVGLAALFGFAPVYLTFTLAQVPVVLTAALCFAFVAMERDAERPTAGYASGAFTTLGASMKIFYAPAGAHLLCDRRRFLGAMGTAAGLLVASLALFGPDAHLVYLDVLGWGKGWGVDPPPPAVGSTAYFRPLYGLGAASLVVRVVGVLAVIALALSVRHSADVTVRRATFALGLAAVPLLAPKANLMDLTVLLVPAIILLAIELERPGGYPAIPVLAVLLVHLQPSTLRTLLDPPTWLAVLGAVPAGWVQPAAWGSLALFGLAAVRVADGAAVPAWVPVG